MEKLFYKDQYIKNFTANILEIKEIDKKFHIYLDKTAFFPGGGGQFCDLGEIDGNKVFNVYEEDGKIYHVLDIKPKDSLVKCSIDWDRREDGMHQHFAQHVLSGCFYTKYKANTTGIHIGKDFSTVDIKGYLEEDQIRNIEIYANEVIRQNIPLTILTPSKEELDNIYLRRDLPNTDEEIRIVKIGDLDINACCGVHPKSTGELRLIKIKRWEKNRQSTRIEFLSGKRAIDDVLRRDIYLTKACKYLKSKEEDLLKAINNLEEKIDKVIKDRKKLENIVSKYEEKELIESGKLINDIIVISKIYENEDIRYISKLVNKITEEHKNIVLLIGNDSKEKVNLVFASSKDLKDLNMNSLIKKVLPVVNGKGGGSSNLAQGAGSNNENLDEAIKLAIKIIKN
ncbi:alanyl-tRNA editing protein [Romboutsia sp. Marseille-P6047]|uniref:alanyl-tRNA editing protein n=1 Tax=Romboutsia sp. Marseille-P6047 TaxID=2161817 RepID=UPI000822E6E8|nr:DHHA1 domain-containing protein [Romboutsia sp. Marseille-P6047]SCH42652.1 Alanine--tRNA ligase [uncultured Clostridium sp.]